MELSQILKNYGLTNKEADVYLACLSAGGGSAHKISQSAGLPRSTTYEILDSLKEQGLVSMHNKKKVKQYNPENPKLIASLAKDKAEMLEKSLPSFMALYNNSQQKPSVRFYEGKRNLNVVFKEILAEAQNFVGFSSPDDLIKIMGSEYENFVERRVKKKISTRIIMRESKIGRGMKETGPQELRQVKFVPNSYQHHTLVLAWNQKVAFLNIGSDYNVMIIESKDASQFFRSTFEFMWSILN